MNISLKKNIVMIGVLALFILIGGGLFLNGQQEHEEVLEEVNVTRWLVPVFAVDDSGRPIRNLDPKNLEITLNGKLIREFVLLKRTFGQSERLQERVDAPSAQQAPLDRKKVLVLLFDNTFSSETTTARAKKIAKKIIMDAEVDTRFFLMTIEPYAGLVYKGEGDGKNKTQLLRLLKKEIVEKRNKRIVNVGEFLRQMTGKVGRKFEVSRYEGKDFQLFEEAAAKPIKRHSMGFFNAFETLYFYLNSIPDNKFVYLFSEGMSESFITSNKSIGGARGMYNFYLKKIAEILNHCGAVFFMINTMGVDQYTSKYTTASQYGGDVVDSFSILSGEESLHFLAKQSGGTYFEGSEDQIVERIENMHLAYYEVSFPEPPQLEDKNTRDIKIKSKQKNVNIYTLRSLERRKHYSEMNSLEKDMLVLNLVTQPPNAFIESKLDAYSARVTKTKKDKNSVLYSVVIPPGLLRQNLDLYKVWVEIDEKDMVTLQKIEKESIYPLKDKVDIKFQLTNEKKEKRKKKEESKSEVQTFFVLINGGVRPARASVQGFELYDEDPALPKEEEPVYTKLGPGEEVTDKDLIKILNGVADYCDRLKQSVFHFYCKEKIVETRRPLNSADMKNHNIHGETMDKRIVHIRPEESAAESKTERQSLLTDVNRKDATIDEKTMKKGVMTVLADMRNKAYTKVSGYLFGYRLLKKGSDITEERDFISSKDNVKVDRNQVVKTNAFFSEKAVFAPITIFDRTRQSKYKYKFLGMDKHHGRRVAVIEAKPKNPVETATIYGRIWIDTSDFSVMKIEADPKSIKSYKLLKDFARKLRTRLKLSLELEFDKHYNGIRFPTKVSMIEKYKGGRIISGYRGARGWERTQTEFQYNDYQFFGVQTDVEVNRFNK